MLILGSDCSRVSGKHNFFYLGFNEADLNLLKHLMKYDREVIFIRTQCDNAIRGLEDEYEDEDLSRDQIFERLQSDFDDYMTNEVFNSCGKKLGISQDKI